MLIYSLENDLLPDPSITTGTSGRAAACGMLTGFDLAGREPPVTPISMASDSIKLTLRGERIYFYNRMNDLLEEILRSKKFMRRSTDPLGALYVLKTNCGPIQSLL